MKREAIINGIAAYKSAQDEIIAVIKQRGGWLSQDKFDSEFCDYCEQEVIGKDGKRTVYPKAARPFPLTYLDGNAFILGDMTGSWAEWLDLAQHMVRAGILTIRGKAPNIEYGLADKP